MAIEYEWRGGFRNDEVNALHADGFGQQGTASDWWARVNEHSLGWVCAQRGGQLVGFVNVAWDGGVHAFLLDTVVATAFRRHGVGTQLVMAATRSARDAGCEWLHVDFEEHLRDFYLGACGFRPSAAGLVAL